MDDAALVRRLAIEKLEAKAAELRPHWAWAKPVLDLDYGFTRQFGRVQPQPAEFPPEIAAELQGSRSASRKSRNSPRTTCPTRLMTEAAGARGTPRRADRDDRSPRHLCRGRSRSIAGASSRSAMTANSWSIEGLVDRVGIARPTMPPIAGGDGDEPATATTRASRSGAGDDQRASDAGADASATAEQAMRKECGFSQALVDDLKAHRLQIARAHLAGGFRGGVRPRALFARASICSTAAIAPARSICGQPRRPSQLAQRSRRHAGRSPARGAREGARYRLAVLAAGARVRGALGIAARG